MTFVWIILGAYTAFACWLTYGRGPFAFAYHPWIARGLRRMGMRGITIGARCYVSAPRYLQPDICGRNTPFWRHEYYHYARQWRPLGPLMPIIYLSVMAVTGYDDHPMEIPAYGAEDDPVP